MCVIQIISLIVLSQPKFGRLPKGERLERMKETPTYYNGQFHNIEHKTQMASDKSRWRMMYEFLFEKRENNRPDQPIEAIKTNLKALDINQNLIVWFGHSSYYIQLDGKRILIDPVFEDASPFSFVNKPFKGTQIYHADDMPDIDYLVITHDHWDHLDYKTVMKLKPRSQKVIVPLGVGEHFERWEFPATQMEELYWYESAELDSHINITALPTRHFSSRDFRQNRTLWASYMLQTPSGNIFIGGDSGYGKHYKTIAAMFPHIDLALMENGQYNEDWRYIHHLPEDLIKAINDLNPTAVLPGHNSKYALARHPWDEPRQNIKQAKSELSATVLLPIIGEVIYLN